ncbi:polysaccharide lyase family 8 super-sandwich domain-containing protein [Paenibacillus oryzisoli]|uniref:polysaccharide lyase family 8 super-sandwich domain-containing protein n=1 Tax=Paenibacillus oryzisoli TaxID=1850517 RepID=UPI003D2DBD35
MRSKPASSVLLIICLFVQLAGITTWSSPTAHASSGSELVSIRLDSNAYTLSGNKTHATVVTAQYADGSEANVTAHSSFYTSRPTVATVNSAGVVTAAAYAGNAYVTALYQGMTASAVVTVNSLVNPGFEEDAAGWSVGSASAIVTEEKYTGSKSLRLTSQASFGNSKKVNIPVLPNTTYKLSFYAKSGGGFRVYARNDAAAVELSNSRVQTANNASPTWQAYTSGTFNSGVYTTITIYLSDTTAAIAGSYHYIDDIQLIEVPTAQPVISSIAFAEPAYSVNSGSQTAAVAHAVLADESSMALPADAVYVSSDPNIASIDASTGQLTGVDIGTALITVIYQGKSATVPVTVSKRLDHIQFSPNQLYMTAGTSNQTVLQAVYEGGTTEVITGGASFSSSAPQVAAVEAQTGGISALQAGSATITATYQGQVAQTTVMVVEPAQVQAIQVSEAPGFQIELHQTRDLSVTAVFQDATVHDVTYTAAYISDQPGVATVNTRGQLTAISEGAAQIQIQFAGQTVSLQVQVTDAYRLMREKWKAQLIGGETLDLNDTDVAAALTKLTNSAQTLWSSMLKAPTRTSIWSDLSTPNSTSLVTSYARLRTMSIAYATAGSSLYQNETLAQDIVSAMDWLYTNWFNESSTLEGYNNEFYNFQIATPMQVTDITTLLYDELTPQQRKHYMDAVANACPTPANGVGYTDEGANRVWRATSVAVRGMITQDSALLLLAKEALEDVLQYVTYSDGFYADGSFIAHVAHPYTGGYGKSLLSSLSDLVYVFDQSQWDLNPNAKQFLFQTVSDSFDPFMYKGAVMDMVRGREISRPQKTDLNAGHDIIAAILKLSRFAPQAEAYKRMVKGWIQGEAEAQSLYKDLPLNVISLAKNVMQNPAIEPRETAAIHRNYASMDRVVHTGTDYAFGLAMDSSRILNYEQGNDENNTGWYAGEGTTYFYNGDASPYTDGFWPTVNPYRMPGTTVDTRVRPENQSEANKLTPNNWVGGTELDNQFGAAGMDLKAYNSTLTAKKSWFMFDDEIVALGAGIQSTDNRPIETIVDNRMLNAEGNQALTVNGTVKSSTLGWQEEMNNVNWIHLEGTGGYYFPQSATVNGLREARTGTWNRLNKMYGTTEPITRNYATLWLNHGANPANQSYEYVFLPNQTAAQVGQYAVNPDVDILVNSPTVQAVRENKLQITAANFWRDEVQTAGGITASGQSSVMVRQIGDELEIGVSDPTQAQSGSLEIEVDQGAAAVLSSDPNVTVTQIYPTIKMKVYVNQAAGKTMKARLKLGVPVETVSSLQLDSTSYELAVGQTHQTVVTAFYNNQSLGHVTDGVRYVSSNPAIAAVSADGLVTAVSSGLAEITAIYEWKSVKAVVVIPGQLIDELSSFSQLYKNGTDMKIDTANSDKMYGDTGRLTRRTSTEEEIMYRMPLEITSYQMTSYYWQGEPTVDFSVYGSGDGVSFQQLPMEKINLGPQLPDSTYWSKIVYQSSSIPAGMTYLKVAFRNTSVNPWNPQIGKVVIDFGRKVEGDVVVTAPPSDNSNSSDNTGTESSTVTPPSTSAPGAPAKTLVLGADAVQGKDGNTVVVRVPEHVETVVLPSDVASQLGDHTLQLDLPSLSIALPKEVLSGIQAAAGTLGNGAQIQISVVALANNSISKLAPPTGVQVTTASEVYNFELHIVAPNGTKTAVRTFKAPLVLTFKVDPKANPDLLGIYYMAEDGKLEYIGGKLNGESMTAQVSHFSSYGVLAYNKTFADVAADFWAHAVIKQMAAKHILDGVDSANFDPQGRVTRAQFAVMLARALGLTEGSSPAGFQDVAEAAWYADAVAKASAAGIVSGRTAIAFAPDADVTREEMAVMIVRAYAYLHGKSAAASGKIAFGDQSQIQSWAQEAVAAAQALGLISGRSNDLFAPQASMSRAESTQVIANLLN